MWSSKQRKVNETPKLEYTFKYNQNLCLIKHRVTKTYWGSGGIALNYT